MRRLALAAAFAALFVGCGGGLTEEPWSGEPDPFEADDTLETAKELAVHARPELHTFSPDGDVDWIRFRVTEADLYGNYDYDPDTSAMDQTGAFYRFYPMNAVGNVHLGLYDRDQAYVFDRYVAMEYCFTEPGIYYLEVEEDAGAGGEYKMFILSGQSPDLATPADLAVVTIDVPATVEVDATCTIDVRVSNCGNAASNKYTLVPYVSTDRVLSAGDCKILGETDPLTEVPGLLYNRSVTMDVTFTAVAPATLPPPGPVYVLVKAVLAGEADTSDNVAVGSTLLGLLDIDPGDLEEPNDSIAEASGETLVSSVVPDLAFWPAGDPDYFQLQHDSAGQWHEVWTDNLRGGADTKIEIVDGTAMPVLNDFDGSLAVDEDSGPENSASYLRFRIDASGPALYYIRVTDVNDSTGGYDLHVRTPPLQPDMYEPNEDRRTWRVLERNVPVGELEPLSFSSDSDQDWFAYSVSVSDGTYDGVAEKWGAPWATHTFTTVSVTGCDTDLMVLDAKGVLVPGGIDDATGANTSASVAVALPAGLYYVGVTCKAGSAGGTYKLSAVAP